MFQIAWLVWDLVVDNGLDANCSDKFIEAIQRASKLFDSVMVG
ncbi:MAG: hypothetical protein ACOYJ2_06495 [Rickettsiales bacterium]